MNELIKVEVKNGEQLVSGRELHKFLEIKTPYTQWFERMSEYGFIENTDFILVSQKSESSNITGVKIVQDHLIKLNMAKEISMLQRNEKGKEARTYFIKCEEAWNSPEIILARANQIQSRMIEDYAKKIEVLENKIQEDRPKVEFYNDEMSGELRIYFKTVVFQKGIEKISNILKQLEYSQLEK